MLAGFGLGAAAIGGLSAQTKAPAGYWITETIEMTDADAFNKSVAGVPALVANHNGHYLTRGGKIVAERGDPPKRITIVAFDTLDQAQQYRKDPASIAITNESSKYQKARSYFVEGNAN
jgi:uncharacterized protein (DUF1330 family)